MKSEPLDRLVLLRLALAGGEVKNSDFTPPLKKGDRDRLIRAGLIDKDDRPGSKGTRKAMFLVLRDQGWDWLEKNLGGELPPRANAVKPLVQILACLKVFLDRRGISLADFVVTPTEPVRVGNLKTLVEESYFRISNGKPRERVRLAAIRAELRSIPREQLDQSLLDMAAQGTIALFPLDNPLDIQQEDKEATLRTPNGQLRHLIYFVGAKSS